MVTPNSEYQQFIVIHLINMRMEKKPLVGAQAPKEVL